MFALLLILLADGLFLWFVKEPVLSLTPSFYNCSFILFNLFLLFLFFYNNEKFFYKDEKNNFYEKILLSFSSVFIVYFVLILLILLLVNPITFSKEVVILKPKDLNSTKILVSNPENIRKVSREVAFQKANKILGIKVNGKILSSLYEIDKENSSIIKYKGKEYWIFPLNFSNVFAYLKTKQIPGYILVDAIDPFKKAKFIKFKHYYSLGTYFEHNIQRLQFYNEPFFRYKYDIHPEIDNKGNLYFISVVYDKLGLILERPKIVYIWNAKNGTYKKYSYEEFVNNYYSKEYKWIDKLFGEETVKNMIEFYTLYNKGVFNRFFNKINVGEITKIKEENTEYQKNKQQSTEKSEIFLIETKKNNLMWFAGITSLNQNDNSLQYAMLVNPINYSISYKLIDLNQITDEQGAIDAVKSKLGANVINWKIDVPLPFIINNKIYWSLNIISNNNYYVKAAVVDARNISNVFIADSLETIFKMIDKNFSNSSINNSSSNNNNKVINNSLSTIKKNKIKYLIKNIEVIEEKLKLMKKELKELEK